MTRTTPNNVTLKQTDELTYNVLYCGNVIGQVRKGLPGSKLQYWTRTDRFSTTFTNRTFRTRADAATDLMRPTS